MTDLSGKVALLTGAGQGVGQGIALALAAAGARVAVTGRTLAKLDQTCALIAERG
ncbi:MAG TPA: SDR family NAD(P)-dependent oxidoreductase, partial [Novosphingobium sp.]|nr:SDR family NAD(P)-dependent oxidoreductase [Novosphingobium sp.]